MDTNVLQMLFLNQNVEIVFQLQAFDDKSVSEHIYTPQLNAILIIDTNCIFSGKLVSRLCVSGGNKQTCSLSLERIRSGKNIKFKNSKKCKYFAKNTNESLKTMCIKRCVCVAAM